MFGWSNTEIGLYGIILNVVAIFGCLVASRLDARLGSKRSCCSRSRCCMIATIGIVSTGPGYTLSAWCNCRRRQRRPLRHGGGACLYRIRAADRHRLRPGAGLLALLYGAQRSAAEAGRYFGIYALAGRATSFLAPFLVANVTPISGSSRLGMAMILLFSAGRLIILIPTPYPAKR